MVKSRRGFLHSFLRKERHCNGKLFVELTQEYSLAFSCCRCMASSSGLSYQLVLWIRPRVHICLWLTLLWIWQWKNISSSFCFIVIFNFFSIKSASVCLYYQEPFYSMKADESGCRVIPHLLLWAIIKAIDGSGPSSRCRRFDDPSAPWTLPLLIRVHSTFTR